MDNNFIDIDEAISRHITSCKPADEKRSRPNIVIRYLRRSNQIAVDAADDETRDALLMLKKLRFNEKSTAFQAYEAIHKGQIRGIIRNAGGMTSEPLMENLHCRKCDILSARPLGNKGTAVVAFQSNSLPYRIGLRSFTVGYFWYKARVCTCETCHKLGHRKEQCPNHDKPRCSTCGGGQHEEGSSCPKQALKWRDCGGAHLATAKNCRKRVEINKQINKNMKQRNSSSAPRKFENSTAGSQDAGQHKSVKPPVITAARRDFCTGINASPRAYDNETQHGRSTYANVVGAVNAHASHPTAPVRETAASKFSSRIQWACSWGGGYNPGVNLEPNKGKAQPSDSPQQPKFEAILEARMAQLEAKIITHVQAMLEKTVEACVRTIMEKLMLSGMFSLGAPPTFATALTGAIHVASRNASSPQQTHGSASFV
ncbi:hypothetical protein HPB48_009962 [Haemaphysalis longicornis]|uniref:CCHC-type domain-containing protein n=1 Tax=Haemaphysalis longicornis TaxID=44386 RepID=A0A9J6FMY5_HAELO|nr:hypothetical protein HPB48_009962 [Haemaphysalis longicornis]